MLLSSFIIPREAQKPALGPRPSLDAFPAPGLPGLARTLSRLPAPPTQRAWRVMSGDVRVLSQQTHRRALVGVPWQLAAAGTPGRECLGLAGSHHLACGDPVERRAPGGGRGHTHRQAASPALPLPPASKVEGWKLCSQGPRAMVPGGIVDADWSETCTLERTQDTS